MEGVQNLPALRIVRIPGRRAVSLAVWLAEGSATETPAEAGVTHLLEHLTLRRCGGRDRRALARDIDRLGGSVDAWTSRTAMGLEVTTTRDGIREAASLLADAVTRPTFEEGDIDLERRIALAEIALARDDPQDVADEALLEAAWGAHPLARPVIGTPETLAGVTAETLRRRHGALIRPGGVLVVAAGDVEAADLEPLASRLPLSRPPERRLPASPRWHGGRVVRTRPGGEQVHVRLAFPAPGLESPDRTVLAVLVRILGGGQSSRLFQRVREEDGLAYDIGAGVVAYRGAGLLEIAWGCDPSCLGAVHGAVHEEIRRLVAGVDGEEVEVAVEGLWRGMVLDAEDVTGRAALEGAWLIERGEPFSLERAGEELRAVTASSVRRLARRVLDPGKAALAVVGPEGCAVRVA